MSATGTATALTVPDITEDMDTLDAALAYIRDGWYVLPVRLDHPNPNKRKSPGSVVGEGWPSLSSCDPKVIAGWFAGTDYGIALHCGRSGAVVLDVDDPDNVPDEVALVMASDGPYQSTRPAQTDRGHYLLLNDSGRRIGNGLGKLATAKKWGEVRGANGVIVVAPSVHPEGGQYHWQRTGLVPSIPDYLAEALPNSVTPEDTATDAEVALFLDAHNSGMMAEAVTGLANALRGKLDRGASCHMSTLGVVTDAMAEAAAGLYPARSALDVLWPIFCATATTRTSTGRVLTAGEAKGEFAGIVAWAVAQAAAADPALARARIAEKFPPRVEEVEPDWERAEPPPGWSDIPPPDEPPEERESGDFDTAVKYRQARLRVDREARRRLDAEENPPPQLPAVKPLDVLLAEPDSPTRYRIDGLQPIASRALLAAQYKAGKTTMAANVIGSLVDGEPFLGTFDVVPARRLVLLDDELGEDMQRRWLRAQGIVNTAAVADVVSLRGRLSTFNPTDDRNRAQWATRLRDLGTDYLILDCLSPVLAAHGIEENDPGEFLVGFDALMAEAGIEDSLLVHHMGHTGERSRGGSRLQDWPDAIWRVVRENDDPASARYFSAYGRDVDVREGRLGFDPASRRLTYAAGSRGDAKTEAALRGVVELLAAHARAGGPGLSGRHITDELGGEHTQKAIRAAAKLAVDRGLVAVEPGERNAKLHRIAKPCSQCGGPMAAGQTERHKSCDQAAEEMAA